jgi:hypothetical protein
VLQLRLAETIERLFKEAWRISPLAAAIAFPLGDACPAKSLNSLTTRRVPRFPNCTEEQNDPHTKKILSAPVTQFGHFRI